MKQYVLESSGGAGQENKMHHQYGLESRGAASVMSVNGSIHNENIICSFCYYNNSNNTLQQH